MKMVDNNYVIHQWTNCLFFLAEMVQNTGENESCANIFWSPLLLGVI